MQTDYDTLLAEIIQLVTNQDSAVIRVIRSVNDPTITIGIKKGKILAVSHGKVRGRSALAHIQAFDSGKMHVHNIDFRFNDRDLPSTDEILALLGGNGGSKPTSRVSDAGRENDVGGRFIEQSAISSAMLPLLSQYIGPMAEYILDDELAALNGQLPQAERQAFIAKLATNIKDSDKSTRFRKEALAALLGDR